MRCNRMIKRCVWIVSFPLFLTTTLHAEYIEGIDTTDENGYGLDSAFRLNEGYPEGYNGQIIVYYYLMPAIYCGYYSYSFDDIQMVPDTVMKSVTDRNAAVNFYDNCFIVKNRDSTYSKIKLLKKITGNRLIYRYGTNTTPNDRMLIKADYDRSIRYNVNNVYNIPGPMPYQKSRDTLQWDPPLPNNNHLLGYILYSATTYDSIVPPIVHISPEQWDSVAFFTTTKVWCPEFPITGYFTMVTVYAEGKSDFLDGWRGNNYSIVAVKRESPLLNTLSDELTIQKTDHGLSISLPNRNDNTGIPSLGIFTPDGRRIADFISKGNTFYWNTPQSQTLVGTYILRINSPSGDVFTRTISLVR